MLLYSFYIEGTPPTTSHTLPPLPPKTDWVCAIHRCFANVQYSTIHVAASIFDLLIPSDGERGTCRSRQSGCDPGGGVREAGSQDCVPPGVPAEDRTPCEPLPPVLCILGLKWTAVSMLGGRYPYDLVVGTPVAIVTTHLHTPVLYFMVM